MATKPKRPRDPFQLAKLIGDISTGQAVETSDSKKVKATRASGAKGGASRVVQQRGVHGRRRGVGEAFAVQGVQQRLPLLGVQGQGRARPR